MGRTKLPPEWKPAIKAIMLGARGSITKAQMANALGNHLGCTISDSRIRQIMYDYENIDGKVQKTLPTQRKGSDEVA